MTQQDLENLSNMVDYVLENEYIHFLESIDEDGDIKKALFDDDFSHIYKTAYHANEYLKSIDI